MSAVNGTNSLVWCDGSPLATPTAWRRNRPTHETVLTANAGSLAFRADKPSLLDDVQGCCRYGNELRNFLFVIVT